MYAPAPMKHPSTLHSGSSRRQALVGLLGLVAATGCGGPAAPASQPGKVVGRTADGRAVESDGRHRDLARAKKSIEELRHAVDGADDYVKHGFDVAVGKADPMKIKKKTPAADLISYLRAKKFRVALGKGVQSERQKFLLDREAKLEFNDGPGKGMKHAEHREIWGKFDELDMHLQEARSIMEKTNQDLIQFNMMIMKSSAQVYADRHSTNLELDDADYEIIANMIGAQRRVEALSGLATGLMTAYHVAIREKKDPKLITTFVEETSKGFPTKGEATPAEARAFVESLKTDLAASKSRYSGWLRALWGEDHYSSYERGVEQDFAKIQDLMAFEKTPAQSASAKATPAAPAGKAALASASNAANAAIDGNAATAFKGVVALATGDFKGAIGAASNLVPDGPLRKGLLFIGSLL